MFTLSNEAKDLLNKAQDFILEGFRKDLTSCSKKFKLGDIDLAYLVDSMTQDLSKNILRFVSNLKTSSALLPEPKVQDVKIQEPIAVKAKQASNVIEVGNFKEILKKNREHLGYSLETFAKLSKIDIEFLKRYEEGKTVPHAKNIIILSHHLKITPNDLFGIKSNAFPNLPSNVSPFPSDAIGNRWKMIREGRGVTLEYLASFMNTTLTTVLMYEQYKRDDLGYLTQESFFKYCNALKVTPNDFLGVYILLK